HDFRVLKILDFFRPFFERCNIHYPIFPQILAVKLLMDGRRESAVFDSDSSKRSNPYIKSLWLYFLYGFILLFFVFGNAYMMQTTIMFGVTLFVLMMALIADFSAVLLDIRDQDVIRTKPID